MKMLWSGTAKKLIGDCLVVTIFVSEEGNKWSKKEKKETWENVLKGMDWIATQAKEYDVEVNFQYLCMNMDKDISVGSIPIFGDDLEETDDLLGKLADELEYEDLTDMYQSIKKDYTEYNIHFLLLVNKDGRSYMCDSQINDAVKSLEYNIVYTEEGKISSSTVAHEALHSYTAFDLYNYKETKEGEKIEKKAYKKLKEEIMLTSESDVENAILSEFTAFLVGWHNEPKEWYRKIVQKDDLESLNFLMKNCKNFDEQGNLIIDLEDEIAKYKYSDGKFIRYKINNNDDLVHWKHFPKDSDEEELWETSEDDEYYYLESKSSVDTFLIPKESGLSYKAPFDADDYDEWEEMKKQA